MSATYPQATQSAELNVTGGSAPLMQVIDPVKVDCRSDSYVGEMVDGWRQFHGSSVCN